MTRRTLWDNWPERIAEGIASGRLSPEQAVAEMQRMCAYAASMASEHASASPEVRLDDAGDLDEIVAQCAGVHLERMDDNAWHLIVSSGGTDVHCSVGARRATVRGTHWCEPAAPPPPKPPT